MTNVRDQLLADQFLVTPPEGFLEELKGVIKSTKVGVDIFSYLLGVHRTTVYYWFRSEGIKINKETLNRMEKYGVLLKKAGELKLLPLRVKPKGLKPRAAAVMLALKAAKES